MAINDNHLRNRILLVLFVGVLMGALDIAIVGPALPAIQKAFHVDDRSVAWIFTVYVLMNLIGTPLMAKLSDALGRRSIYLVSIGLFAVGSLVVASSPTFGVLLIGRAVQGLGAGGIFPVASAVIGDTFPPEKRGSALGMIGAVFGVAFLIGPILGGVLLLFSWHWLFLVNLPIAAVVAIAAMRVLPASRPHEGRPFDLPGMAALGVLLASLAYGISQIDTEHFGSSIASPGIWPFLLAAAVLIPLFGWRERRAPDPILRMDLLNRRQVMLASACALGAGLGEASVVFVPKLLKAALGVSESTASFMLLPIVLMMAVGSPLAGRLLDKYGSRTVVFLGTALLAAGMILVGFAGTSLVLFYLAAALVGLGLSSLLGAPLRYIMLNEAASRERAAAQGALTLFTSTGQLMGGALVGAVAASMGGGVYGYESAYVVVGVIAGLLVILSLGLKGRDEELATAHRNSDALAPQHAGRSAGSTVAVGPGSES